MNSHERRKFLLEYAYLLKENEFDVYIPTNCNVEWFIFSFKNNIGYVQLNNFFGLDFCSIHKPNNLCGTKYSIHREVISPTIQHAKECFIFSPSWASFEDKPIKYKNVEEYLKKSWMEYQKL